MSDAFRLRLDDLKVTQGWAPDTLAELAFNFLDAQAPFLKTTFLEYLTAVAAEENRD